MDDVGDDGVDMEGQDEMMDDIDPDMDQNQNPQMMQQ